MFRRSALVVSLCVIAAVVSGCTGTPAPVVSTSGFSSEEEAFAAAEDTYRAYVDAANARRQDPASKPPPQEFLIGEALESDLATQRDLGARNVAIVGVTKVVSILGASLSEDRQLVEVQVCLDVSDTRLVDATGSDITPADRPSTVGIDVELATSDDGLMIARSSSAESAQC